MKTKYLNRKGFSLVELIIVAGLMGVLIAGFTTVIFNMQKAQNTVIVKQDMSSLIYELQSVIATKDSCSNAVGVDQIFDLSLAQGAGLDVSLRLLNGEILKTGGTLQRFEVNPVKIFISNAAANGVDGMGNKLFQTSLQGVFKSKRRVEGNAVFDKPRNIGSLNLVVDSSQRIIGCYGIGGINPQAICNSLGGQWDLVTSTCQELMSGKSCYVDAQGVPEGTKNSLGSRSTTAPPVKDNAIFTIKNSTGLMSVCDGIFQCQNGVWQTVVAPFDCSLINMDSEEK